MLKIVMSWLDPLCFDDLLSIFGSFGVDKIEFRIDFDLFGDSSKINFALELILT
jgi:hypothetical protein